MSRTIRDFAEESNLIEGIRLVEEGEIEEEVEVTRQFLGLIAPGVEDLSGAVRVFQPGAVLRDQPGMNVRVRNHYPPPGGPQVKELLEEILLKLETADPFETHVDYETLHPYTDGNGRSGRLLWLWQMWRLVPRVPPLGFLHTWYYQSLDGVRKILRRP